MYNSLSFLDGVSALQEEVALFEVADLASRTCSRLAMCVPPPPARAPSKTLGVWLADEPAACRADRAVVLVATILARRYFSVASLADNDFVVRASLHVFHDVRASVCGSQRVTCYRMAVRSVAVRRTVYMPDQAPAACSSHKVHASGRAFL